MHSNQNERINQITSSTLIVGVDIAKFKHVARAQDYRGVEFGKPSLKIIGKVMNYSLAGSRRFRRSEVSRTHQGC
jgi:hypothetical protein